MNGLILAGGQSSRMGQPKSLLKYHDKPQYLHLKDLLSNFCEQVYIACRAEQKALFEDCETIFDSEVYGDIGPMNGLLSAFDRDKTQAWLVLGCDYPLLEKSDLEQLIQARNPAAVATVLIAAEGQLPEPLHCIYEPKAGPLLLEWLAEGHESLRRFLNNHSVEKVVAQNPNCLKSVDTPDEMKAVYAVR